MKNKQNDYVIRVLDTPGQVDARAWNELLDQQPTATPFMRHEYLAALHDSGSAAPATGWTPRFITLWQGDQLHGACPLYLKDHSYGEYVFDWAWANAYQQHGLAYYPKAVAAIPFTPVPGARLLARDQAARAALIEAMLSWCQAERVSSLHLLFGADEDLASCGAAGMMQRHSVQFHWENRAPASCWAAAAASADASSPRVQTERSTGRYASFDDFLASLAQDKRKKIRQERRKVAQAGVRFRWVQGSMISASDWDFFYRCYERTYYEHGNAPYLARDFFARMARDMSAHWLLFIAMRGDQAVAASLIALDPPSPATGQNGLASSQGVAYGRYWGALERVDCLHFEACYYQPIEWCIAHGYARFEGGAQGEHKMARALMPVKTGSAHWLAHPAFADAVERFLEREGQGIENYLGQLDRRSPFRPGKRPRDD